MFAQPLMEDVTKSKYDAGDGRHESSDCFAAQEFRGTAIRVAGVERDVYERDSGVESFAHQLGKEAQRAPAGYTSERRNFGRPSHGLAVTKSDWRTC